MTAPMWVLLVGVFVLGERVNQRDWTQLAIVSLGVGIIVAYESRGASLNAVLLALASGVTYAGVVLSLRTLRGLDSAWLAALNLSVTAVCLAPWAFADRTPWPAGIQWPLLLAFGVLQMGLPYVLFARGLRNIPGHEATAIGMLEPILVPVWVLIAWGERPAWWTVVGGSLILAGLAMRYLRRTRPAPSSGG
ncbi:MAG: DMT family transporter [Planctomycetaceae bacterium]